MDRNGAGSGRGDAPAATEPVIDRRGPAPGVRAGRRTDFPSAKRKRFLDAVAATCNATEAARLAGVDVTAAYRLRDGSPDFAAAWERALEVGYVRLEEQLLARALEAVDAVAVDPAAVTVPPLAEPAGARARGWADPGFAAACRLALALLNRRHAGRGGAGSRGRRTISAEEVNALLVKRLDGAAAARQRRRAADAPALSPPAATALPLPPDAAAGRAGEDAA